MTRSTLFQKMATVTNAKKFEKDEGDRFYYPLHKHDHFSEIFLIHEGEGVFTIDNKTFTAGPDTMLFYHRGVWHEEMSVKHPFRASYIEFKGLEMYGLPPDYFIPPGEPPIIELKEHAGIIRQLFADIVEELNQAQPESHACSKYLFGILLIRLARITHYQTANPRPPLPSHAAVMTVRRYIEENYRNEITLELLARIAFLSPYHLAHLFKDQTGLSPIRFLIRYRMEVAMRYLTTTALTSREIAELVGYSSHTSFYNVFKKTAGMTPGRYRAVNSQDSES